MMHQLDDGTWTNPAVIPVSPDMSIPQLLFDREARGPHQVMVERLIRGEWYEVTAEEFMNHVLKLARGLYGLGARPGDRVAILAATSYEWAAFDMAILSLGAITIPIYESDSAAQISHILQDAGVSLVVTHSVQQAELVESVADEQVKEIFALERGDERKIVRAGHDVSEQTVRDIASALNLETVATIVYTSGTTGLPRVSSSPTATSYAVLCRLTTFCPTLSLTPRTAPCCSYRSRTSWRVSSWWQSWWVKVVWA